MKCYALHKKDGTVAIMQVFDPKASPATELPRMPPESRALFTGEWEQIDEAEWRSTVAQRPRHKNALVCRGGRLSFDNAKAVAIDAAPRQLTLEERIAALEAKKGN